MNVDSIEYKIALEVYKLGGKTYYVGGYVRDYLLGNKNDDVDIEVHGVRYDDLYNILNKISKPFTVGSNFGIFTLRDYNIDIALPRKEQNTGIGHKDFKVYTDPFIGEIVAAKRRDFTINSLMMNVLTDEILDFFNGKQDLLNKTIRHIDDNSFIEDPLRVLRACQFASRFDFEIAPETIKLCSSMDITCLSKERVESELNKALLKSNKPSIFFTQLRKMNQLHYWFETLEKTIDLKQDKIFHPEGDVFTHSMMVLDEATKYRDKVSFPLGFMYLCLCHDFGKITKSFEKDGRIHAYGHDVYGNELIRPFLRKFMNNKKTIDYVLKMAPLHMMPNKYARDNSATKVTNDMFYRAVDPQDLIYFALCDHVLTENDERLAFLNERLDVYSKMIKKRYVTGDDLIKHGLKPDNNFSKILDYAHLLRMANVEYEDALKQVLAYAKKFKD